MRKLLVLLSFLFIALTSNAQPVDFSTYERVIHRGDITIVHQGDEYRMIVGALKSPKINLLLGMSAEQAAHQMDRIQKFGKREDNTARKRLISFCGETFFLVVKGNGEHQSYAFRTSDASSRFIVNSKDVSDIIEAIR